jgi:hypothetical protein
MKIFIGEDDPNTAVAYVPMFQQKYVQLIRKQNRWFLNVEKNDAQGLAFLLDVEGRDVDRVKEFKKILDRSNTVEEFDRAIDKFKAEEDKKMFPK